jgi:hypothetical protein
MFAKSFFSSIAAIVVAFVVVGRVRGDDPPAFDSVVKKHLAFARAHLNDDDELLRASSLDIIGTYDPLAFCDAIRDGLSDRSDLVRDAALEHLLDIATDHDLVAVQARLMKLTSQPMQPIDANGVAIEPIASEMLCLQLLYKRGGSDWKKRVSDLLEQDLRSKKNHPRWEMVVQTVGHLQIHSLASTLQQEASTASEKLYAAASLTEMGDMDAAAFLRKQMMDAKYQGFIIRDLELVKALKLSVDDLAPLLKGATLERRIDVVRAMASQGQTRQLNKLWHDVIESQNMGDSPDTRVARIRLIDAVRATGDQTFIKRLDDYFDAATSDSDKMMASEAVIYIARRAKDARK